MSNLKPKLIALEKPDPAPCCSEGEPCGSAYDVSRRRFLVAASTAAAGLAAGPVLAEGQRQSYSDLVKSHHALSNYWRFDGDLKDSAGKVPAKGPRDLPFVDGVVEGHSLSLTPKFQVAVPNAKPVGHGAATLELFFKLNALPSGTYDPVIISRASEKLINYVMGVKRDRVPTASTCVVPTTPG